MPVRHLYLAAAAAWAAFGCVTGPEAAPVRVTVEAEAGSGLDLGALKAEPPEGVVAIERFQAGRADVLARAGAKLKLTHPEGCPLEISLEKAEPGSRVPARMRAWFDTGGDNPQAGFGATFQIVSHPGCPEAGKGKLEWKRLSGPELPFKVERGGYLLAGNTPPAPGTAPTWGVVPFSPASRGEQVFQATWRGEGHADVVRTVSIAAVARATGIPTVGQGHRIYLGGEGWTIEKPPFGGKATLARNGPFTTILPDVRGRWILKDGRGTSYAVQVGKADEMQFDCVRSDCHASIGTEIEQSPMTTVLSRALDGELEATMDPRCALACHAAGEPGLPDGGFTHVARDLGVGLPSRGAKGTWASLPRDLRRTGGVGCIACHGPAAIPERSARWSVLRADVCAICHDAPPRYRHVETWRGSRMARADAAPGARDGRCATCHTTWGFLAAVGVRTAREQGAPPPEAGAIGLACMVCHTNHGARLPGDTALIRKLDPPASLAPVDAQQSAQSGSVCLRCHAPEDASGAPAASAAALFLARGGVAVKTGEPLKGVGTHANVAGGCAGCHVGARSDGSSHTFKTDPKRCAPCHAGAAPAEKPDARGRLLAARARALAARLTARRALPAAPAAGPVHAADARLPADPALARATRDVLLVLEDPAAAFHNAAYARRLLDEAETLLGP